MQATAKRCLYDILGVERDANNDDIKRAYKKLALVHHPDRNPDNVEEATRMFHQVQDAYEVLTDPNERAWYDQNRAAILRNTKSDSYRNVDIEEEDLDFIDIFQYVSSSCYQNNFNESKPVNFYSVYDKAFEQLVLEEIEFSKKGGNTQKSSGDFYFGKEKFPKFGGSADDPQKVIRFYTAWAKFTTNKTFSWVNKWNMHDGSNRFERRYIEKENEKMRAEAKRKFEADVKELILFVKRRDPRMEKIQKEKMEQEEEKRRLEREKQQREEAIKKEMHRLKMEEIRRRQEMLEQEASDEEEDYDEPDEEDELEDDLMAYYNTASSKKKKSKQYESEEEEELHDDDVIAEDVPAQEEEQEQQPTEEEPAAANDQQQPQQQQSEAEEQEESEDEEEVLRQLQKKKQKKNKKQKNFVPSFADEASEEEDIKPDIKPRVTKKNRANKKNKSVPVVEETLDETPASTETADQSEQQPAEEQSEQPDGSESSKRDNKKKRNKGKSVASTSSSAPSTEDLKCNVCGESFSSKNKLFNHVKEKGHAIAVKLTEEEARQILTAEAKKGKKSKKGKKK
jgi:DnaJ family protein A protein 5